jgi:hypothetical protein
MNYYQFYVDEYIMGWEVVTRSRPSEERWPVSHGPFGSRDGALYWALDNLEKGALE